MFKDQRIAINYIVQLYFLSYINFKLNLEGRGHWTVIYTGYQIFENIVSYYERINFWLFKLKLPTKRNG